MNALEDNNRSRLYRSIRVSGLLLLPVSAEQTFLTLTLAGQTFLIPFPSDKHLVKFYNGGPNNFENFLPRIIAYVLTITATKFFCRSNQLRIINPILKFQINMESIGSESGFELSIDFIRKY